MHTFRAVIQRPPGTGTWHYVDIPFDAVAAFGSRGQVRVRGALDGVPFRTTLMAGGAGGHYMVCGKELREQAGVGVGDEVEIQMELDDAPRAVELHPDLAAALAADDAARERFERMAPSHQKRWNEHVLEAKKDETRARRIQQVIDEMRK